AGPPPRELPIAEQAARLHRRCRLTSRLRRRTTRRHRRGRGGGGSSGGRGRRRVALLAGIDDAVAAEADFPDAVIVQIRDEQVARAVERDAGREEGGRGG